LRPPLVSIVTPTYNRAAWLGEVIDSIEAQGWRPIEHWIIDDGSTDDTQTLVQAKQRAATVDLRYVYKPNGGEASATNLGWILAEGEFFGVVCSDDPQPPQLVEKIIAGFEGRPDAVVVYPDWWKIDDASLRTEAVEVPEHSVERLIGQFHCYVGPGAFIRRRAVIGAVPQLRSPAYRYVSDFDCWLNLARLGPFARLPEPVAHWRQHDEAETARGQGEPMAREHLRLAYDYFRRSDLPPTIRVLERQAKASAWSLARRMLAHAHPLRSAAAAFLRVGYLPADERWRWSREQAGRLLSR
jgi:glycosyltransferase involved in cell wall biosynthesis